jgi:hypothetical protein
MPAWCSSGRFDEPDVWRPAATSLAARTATAAPDCTIDRFDDAHPDDVVGVVIGGPDPGLFSRC